MKHLLPRSRHFTLLWTAMYFLAGIGKHSLLRNYVRVFCFVLFLSSLIPRSLSSQDVSNKKELPPACAPLLANLCPLQVSLFCWQRYHHTSARHRNQDEKIPYWYGTKGSQYLGPQGMKLECITSETNLSYETTRIKTRAILNLYFSNSYSKAPNFQCFY